MKDTKLKLPTERDVQSGNEGPNRPGLGGKSEAELNYTIKEEKIKIIKSDPHPIEQDKKKIFWRDRNG